MKKSFYLPLMAVCCMMVFGITSMNACPPSGEKADATEQTDGQSETFRFVSMDMSVSDMTCGGCENKVKAALGEIDGVVATKKVCSQSDVASISYDPEVTNQEEIMAQLSEKTGYKIAVIQNAAMDADGAIQDGNESDGKTACAADCSKECCKGKKGKKQCTAAQKAACDKAKADKMNIEQIKPE